MFGCIHGTMRNTLFYIFVLYLNSAVQSPLIASFTSSSIWFIATRDVATCWPSWRSPITVQLLCISKLIHHKRHPLLTLTFHWNCFCVRVCVCVCVCVCVHACVCMCMSVHACVFAAKEAGWNSVNVSQALKTFIETSMRA